MEYNARNCEVRITLEAYPLEEFDYVVVASNTFRFRASNALPAFIDDTMLHSVEIDHIAFKDVPDVLYEPSGQGILETSDVDNWLPLDRLATSPEERAKMSSAVRIVVESTDYNLEVWCMEVRVERPPRLLD